MVTIGGIELKGNLCLAPMAGVSDFAFRGVCRALGAALTTTEMVSAKALVYRDEKTKELLYIPEGEHPCAAQIFGHEPEVMAEGAALALEISGADILDINMGCPVGKIVKAGDGSALMKDPELAGRIIESVKKAQESYLKYFRGKKHVLDIGCGRGEFLSLMKDNGINAEGVDIYEPYTDYCNSKGLKAHCGDGTAYLAKMEKTDGIFVGQVVEHMKTGEIIALCNTAYEKLEKGGCIIIETPNPTSLSIYTNAFYIDPSHIKPVHPLTLQYFLEKAGFTDVEIIYTEQSRPPHSIPELKISGGEGEEFNKAMKKVSDMIFGSQDYAAVAIKK